MTRYITLARKDVESLHIALKAWIKVMTNDDSGMSDAVLPEWMEFSNHINTVLYDS